MSKDDKIGLLYKKAYVRYSINVDAYANILLQPGATVKTLFNNFLKRVAIKTVKGQMSLTLTYSENELSNEALDIHVLACLLADKLNNSGSDWKPGIKGFEDRQTHSFLQYKELVTPEILGGLIDLGVVGVFVKLTDIIKAASHMTNKDRVIGALEETAFLSLLLLYENSSIPEVENGKT